MCFAGVSPFQVCFAGVSPFQVCFAGVSPFHVCFALASARSMCALLASARSMCALLVPRRSFVRKSAGFPESLFHEPVFGDARARGKEVPPWLGGLRLISGATQKK